MSLAYAVPRLKGGINIMDKPKNNEPKVYLLRKSDTAGKIDIGTGDKTIINIQKHMKKVIPRCFA